MYIQQLDRLWCVRTSPTRICKGVLSVKKPYTAAAKEPVHIYSQYIFKWSSSILRKHLTGCLRLVGSFKLQVYFAKYNLFYRALSQKGPIILCSPLIVATPYQRAYMKASNIYTHARTHTHTHTQTNALIHTHSHACPTRVYQGSLSPLSKKAFCSRYLPFVWSIIGQHSKGQHNSGCLRKKAIHMAFPNKILSMALFGKKP